MRLTAFPLFSELTPEIRNRIWEFAIISHIRDLADRLPPRFHYLWAVRQSFATLGDVPGKTGAALYFNLRDPYNGQKVCFENDEFENLVHCFPISAVCHETRINVAKVCRVLVPNMLFNYDTTTSSSLTPPEKGATFDHCYKEDSTIVRVARNRELHVSEIFWQTRTKDVTIPTMHLLNMYELFDASMDILPYLEHIEVYHVVRGRGSQRTTFATNWKRNDRVRW